MDAGLDLDQHVIAAVCKRFGVRRLAVFGSAVTGDFAPDRSDVDVLVEFDTDLASTRTSGSRDRLDVELTHDLLRRNETKPHRRVRPSLGELGLLASVASSRRPPSPEDIRVKLSSLSEALTTSLYGPVADPLTEGCGG